MPDRLLLDTCAFIWLVQGSRRLKSGIREEIDAVDQVWISAISAWEVSLKAERSELRLPLPPERWWAEAVSHHELTVAELTPVRLMEANRLPWHHRDPADRFIIATAIGENLPVVTADARFAEYGVEVRF